MIRIPELVAIFIFINFITIVVLFMGWLAVGGEMTFSFMLSFLGVINGAVIFLCIIALIGVLLSKYIKIY